MRGNLSLAVDERQSDHAGPSECRPDRIVVLANRAPLRHDRTAGGDIRVTRSGSGLVTALESLIHAHSGVWISHAAGNADTVVDCRRVRISDRNPAFHLRYVGLPEDVRRGYYDGFANEGLWALCHPVGVRPVFRDVDARMYRNANARFVEAAVHECNARPAVVLVQDYHLALAPAMLRVRLPSSTIATFWHIPWPSARIFSGCPYGPDLVRGLLGSHLLGLQTANDCHNFLESAALLRHARVDWARGHVTHAGTTTAVRAFPVGIDWTNPVLSATPPADLCRRTIDRELDLPPGAQLIVGIDRLDYTKGLEEKLRVVEHLLESRADLRGRLVLVQVAEPSRQGLGAYQATRARVAAAAERINRRFAAGTYRPIVLREAHHDAAEVYRLYRAADVCYVGSLRDGMNLVAKEFVSAREDERGVLILSRFAGAARQLEGALLINPDDTGDSARVLAEALDMPEADQVLRLRRMRRNVRDFDARWWADAFLAAARAS